MPPAPQRRVEGLLQSVVGCKDGLSRRGVSAASTRPGGVDPLPAFCDRTAGGRFARGNLFFATKKAARPIPKDAPQWTRVPAVPHRRKRTLAGERAVSREFGLAAGPRSLSQNNCAPPEWRGVLVFPRPKLAAAACYQPVAGMSSIFALLRCKNSIAYERSER